MMAGQTVSSELDLRGVALDGGSFMRALALNMANALEEVVGIEDASGFISIVAQSLGQDIHDQYCEELGTDRVPRACLADVLVDLKRRIDGDFYVIEENEERIVLGNRRCPFGDGVRGRHSLCMLTSNVFGVIASESTGYARVELGETIAAEDVECRVVVHLRRAQGIAGGREYFADV